MSTAITSTTSLMRVALVLLALSVAFFIASPLHVHAEEGEGGPGGGGDSSGAAAGEGGESGGGGNAGTGQAGGNTADADAGPSGNADGGSQINLDLDITIDDTVPDDDDTDCGQYGTDVCDPSTFTPATDNFGEAGALCRKLTVRLVPSDKCAAAVAVSYSELRAQLVSARNNYTKATRYEMFMKILKPKITAIVKGETVVGVSCPAFNAPRCAADEVLVGGGVNSVGCQNAPRCVKKTEVGTTDVQGMVNTVINTTTGKRCPAYVQPTCRAGQSIESGVMVNGCLSAPYCVADSLLERPQLSFVLSPRSGLVLEEGQDVSGITIVMRNTLAKAVKLETQQCPYTYTLADATGKILYDSKKEGRTCAGLEEITINSKSSYGIDFFHDLDVLALARGTYTATVSLEEFTGTSAGRKVSFANDTAKASFTVGERGAGSVGESAEIEELRAQINMLLKLIQSLLAGER